jgi:Fur family zinc uptake transcriptional regulator
MQPEGGDCIAALQHQIAAGSLSCDPARRSTIRTSLWTHIFSTMSPPVFHAPDHDHERCTADALKHAEVLCMQRAQRLTPIRRQVLEVLLESHKPLGAYEIMDRSSVRGGRPAPITIYRALDFLRDNGLVHRIESRNAFIACVNNHATGDLVVFLICEHCGAVGEAASAAVTSELKAAARSAGFTPKAPVIEIGGVCAHCRQHDHA